MRLNVCTKLKSSVSLSQIHCHCRRMCCTSLENRPKSCVLHSHGLSGASLWEVSRAYIIGRLTYSLPPGGASALLGSGTSWKRWSVEWLADTSYLPTNIHSTRSSIMLTCISFAKSLLATLIPPRKVHTYDLRERRTNLQLPPAHTTSDKNFFNRIILTLNAP